MEWKAPANVSALLYEIKGQYHHPRLELAQFAVGFNESKPFIKGRFNWGSVVKFSNKVKLWQEPEKFDFCFMICSDVWHSILNATQRSAYLDLCLTRCEVEYEPETIVEGKKKKVVKDEWGRVKYSSEVKLEDNGQPKWQVVPLDVTVMSQNISRYGLWFPEWVDLKSVMNMDGGHATV